MPRDDFFYFLNKSQKIAQINRLTIFEKYNENKEHESLEIQAENIYKESDLRFSLQMTCIWAENLDDLLEITYLLSKQGQNNVTMKLAMEILLIFSYLNSKKNMIKSLEIRNFSLYASFGCLLGRFFRKIDCELEVFGKTYHYFSRFMPDLHFPISISKSRYGDFFEKLSDFVLTFLAHLEFADFVQFFINLHLPPQDVIFLKYYF